MNLSKLQEMVKDREAWRASVHRVPKSQTQLSDLTTKAPPVASRWWKGSWLRDTTYGSVTPQEAGEAVTFPCGMVLVSSDPSPISGRLRSHSWHHQTSHGKAALWEQEGRELSVILTFTTAKGTTREHTSLTESRGELGMSAWLWKSKDVSLAAGQTQVQTPAPLLTPWDLVLSVGSPVARSISKPRTLLEMQNRLNWNLHFKPDPWGFLHKVKV
ncbi:hypothetical protein MJG53_011101 [Ovis ammon polii x Ovis aries]|uniref:Uncharacterized protein n=1 Tax=Ovis ammon polii x Ovis aries TaxID=2918886 RepID=A0ACB9USD0_9CETA|nr:hypothetical protein MJG53_011101 [Ovis ammon polii x Ovis aries]